MAIFQRDGLFSNRSLMKYQWDQDDVQGQGVANMTLCLRVRLQHLRERTNYLLSYSLDGKTVLRAGLFSTVPAFGHLVFARDFSLPFM